MISTSYTAQRALERLINLLLSLETKTHKGQFLSHLRQSLFDGCFIAMLSTPQHIAENACDSLRARALALNINRAPEKIGMRLRFVVMSMTQVRNRGFRQITDRDGRGIDWSRLLPQAPGQQYPNNIDISHFVPSFSLSPRFDAKLLNDKSKAHYQINILH